MRYPASGRSRLNHLVVHQHEGKKYGLLSGNFVLIPEPLQMLGDVGLLASECIGIVLTSLPKQGGFICFLCMKSECCGYDRQS